MGGYCFPLSKGDGVFGMLGYILSRDWISVSFELFPIG